jgi:tRNA threonylcarbamoyladenosine biosynthesis protein TsaB
MKLLAIETSCEHASVALRVDDEIVSYALEGHANHSERILPTIRQLLAGAGLKPASLDAVAFGKGPGAFTGLRLACGVAQGMAMGAGIGVIPVSSLAALAMQAGGSAVLTLTDARMGEIYAAGYELEHGVPVERIAPVCVAPADLNIRGAWQVVGSALQAYPYLFPSGAEGVLGRDATLVPRAREVALLAGRGLGEAIAPELAAPLYVRDKVALTAAERLALGGKA